MNEKTCETARKRKGGRVKKKRRERKGKCDRKKLNENGEGKNGSVREWEEDKGRKV